MVDKQANGHGSTDYRHDDPPFHPDLNKHYKYLTPEDIQHFIEDGWFRVPQAMNEKLVDRWMEDLFVRAGYDEQDKSTWDSEYFHMPRHREAPPEEFCPLAWNKIKELCGGGLKYESRVDEERETWYGDAFIVNFGTAEKAKGDYEEFPPNEKDGWHCDDDWFRMFLDSGEGALTLVHLYTDVPDNGGGTWVCEDAVQGVQEYLYENRDGLDPPFSFVDTICRDMRNRKRFRQLTGKKGDVLVLNGRLPHTVAINKLHFARVITNPHVSLKEPMNLNRHDGNYSVVEQALLHSLDRTAIPEYKALRPRQSWYPRNQDGKRVRAPAELARMEAAAIAKGLPKESVDSFYQKKGTQEWIDFERRNGFDLALNPAGPRKMGESQNGLNAGRFKSAPTTALVK